MSAAKKPSAYVVIKTKKAEEAVKTAAEATMVAENETEKTEAAFFAPDHQRVLVTNLVTVITALLQSNQQMQQQLQTLTTSCADAVMRIVGEALSKCESKVEGMSAQKKK